MVVPLLNELKILVVDDTVVYRRVMQKVVEEIANAKVVGVAANGRLALERLEQLEVDIVLLDVEMPEMNGIEALKEIRRRWPNVGVVLLSGADKRAADLTMQALDLGALEFVPKADTGDVQRNQRQLIQHLDVVFRGFVQQRVSQCRERTSAKPASGATAAARGSSGIAAARSIQGETRSEVAYGTLTEPTTLPGLGRRRGGAVVGCALPGSPLEKTTVADTVARQPSVAAEVLLIGSSTGGPQALAKIIPQLPGDLGVPVLIVQHMPPVFTRSLAERLNRLSALLVGEASGGQIIESNRVFVAPGGQHMTVQGELGQGPKRIVLSDDPPVNSCRPSVDVLFRSAISVYGGATLSVVLTGMGEDGLDGVRALRVAGGKTLTQNEESCVVYGMPRAVELAGCTDESVSLENMANQIVKWLRRGTQQR